MFNTNSFKMALFVCKCLNVSIESDKTEDNVDIGKLKLPPSEQRDTFFNEKLVSNPTSAARHAVSQPAVIGHREVGRWTVHSCLACGQSTHAILRDIPDTMLICKSLQTTPERVTSLKRSTNFSPVFNLLVPEVSQDFEMKENVDTSNLLISDKEIWPAQQVLGSLNKLLKSSLQSQLEAVEETVRQFRDQKYAEFEAYRERANRDHKILISIISKTRNSVDSDGNRSDPADTTHLPPLQRRRLSSIKDAKKIPPPPKPMRAMAAEEDSLEAEDLFELEGMDDVPSSMLSDQDDYDDSDPGDEGIHISRSRGGAAVDLARSLPIAMPGFPETGRHHSPRDFDDDEDPLDIAASIKALARSVHGDVFDLPRPRRSTQI